MSSLLLARGCGWMKYHPSLVVRSRLIWPPAMSLTTQGITSYASPLASANMAPTQGNRTRRRDKELIYILYLISTSVLLLFLLSFS